MAYPPFLENSVNNPYQSPDQPTDSDRTRRRPIWVSLIFVFSLAGLGAVMTLGLFTSSTVTTVAPPVSGQIPVVQQPSPLESTEPAESDVSEQSPSESDVPTAEQPKQAEADE